MGFDIKRMDIYRKVPKDLTQVSIFNNNNNNVYFKLVYRLNDNNIQVMVME